MLTIPVYNSQGKELKNASLPNSIFGLKVNPALLHLVTTVFQGNERKGTAKVKTRAERRGGGRKPFKQKGTASARAGTTRSPIWRKGGRIFGPTGEQNYHRDLPTKVRVKSLLMSLSAKAQAQSIVGIESFDFKEVSTKSCAALLKLLPIQRKVLLVMPKKEKNIILSTRNIPTVTTRTYNNINTLDILTHDFILVMTEALPLIEKKWGEHTFKGVMTDEQLAASLGDKPVMTTKKVKAPKTAKKEKTPVAKAKPAVKKASKAKAKKSPKAKA